MHVRTVSLALARSPSPSLAPPFPLADPFCLTEVLAEDGHTQTHTLRRNELLGTKEGAVRAAQAVFICMKVCMRMYAYMFLGE